ncbi:putative ribonuclease H-like domain-containing protein [Tanacetum coccineum]
MTTWASLMGNSDEGFFSRSKEANHNCSQKAHTGNNAGEEPNKHPDLKTDEKPVDKEDQVFLDELERLKRQEQDANDAAEALRKEFAQDTEDLLLQAGAAKASSTNIVNTASTPVCTASPYGGLSFTDLTNTDQDDSEIPALEEIYNNPTDGIFTNASYDDEGAVADFTNLETIMNVSPIPTSRINSIHPSTLILGDPKSAVQTRSKVTKSSRAHAFEEMCNSRFGMSRLLVDLPYGKKAIGTKWMDVKSAFLYGKIDEEVYVSQPLGFIDPKMDTEEELLTRLIFIKKDKNVIMMSSMGELTFFLGLQVKQKEDGIFISQDKYVAEILKKFDFVSVKTASTPIETQKPLVKDEEASDVDVHLYRSMIGSLMYLTASRPDIMFAVCACSRVSSFDLEAYSDSDYAGSNLRQEIQTEVVIYLAYLGLGGLISWQCKKAAIVAYVYYRGRMCCCAICCGGTFQFLVVFYWYDQSIWYIVKGRVSGLVDFLYTQLLFYYALTDTTSTRSVLKLKASSQIDPIDKRHKRGLKKMRFKEMEEGVVIPDMKKKIVKEDVSQLRLQVVKARWSGRQTSVGDYLVVYRVNGNFQGIQLSNGDDQQDWEIVTWRLYEACGVCILEFKDGTVIHMLVERKYPLSKELLQRMLDFGLEVEVECTQALASMVKICSSQDQTHWLVQKQMVFGKDKSIPLMVDNSHQKTVSYGNVARKDSKRVKDYLDQKDLSECLNTSSMKFKESTPKKHEVQRIYTEET